ncbi:MAG: hypothetical protein V1851_03050 [Patescibacteria group bacterium]
MFFQNTKFHKTISFFLMMGFLSSSLFLSKPKKSEAFWGIGDTVVEVGQNVITNVLNTAETIIQTGIQYAQENKDFVLDGIAWQIAKMSIRSMTTSIVEWINSGFDGKPAFMTNYQGMLTDIADEVIGEYINGTALSGLCSPYSFDIKMSLQSYYYKDTKTAQCTLSEIIGNAENALDALEDDWNWGTWVSMTTNSGNNPYSAYMEARDVINTKIALKTQEKTYQLNWGSGFMSWEKYDEVVDYETGEISKINPQIQTPGSVISTQLNKTLGLGADSLVTADEFNEIVNALLMQLTKNIMSSTGLLGQEMDSYSDTEDIQNIKNSIINSLTNLINNEIKYNSIKNDSLLHVLNTKDTLENLFICLNSNSNMEVIKKTEALLVATNNLNNEILPLENRLKTEIGESDNLIILMDDLKRRTEASINSSELNDLSQEYLALPTTHELNDISEAETERDGSYPTYKGIILIMDELLNKEGERSVDPAPEIEKGLNQRLNECTSCKNDSNKCKDYYDKLLLFIN